jgi:hypothetical protein
MPPAKVIVASALGVLALTGCGTTAIHPSARGASRGQIDDPRTAKADRVQCLKNDHLPVQQIGLAVLEIGVAPSGPRVVFEPAPGAAQGAQIEARAQGAEVIGSALLYPNQGSDAELDQIETCLTQGVSG